MAEVLDLHAQSESFEPQTSADLLEESFVPDERPHLSTVPRDVDATKFRLAYGRQGIPKLVLYLPSLDLIE